MREYSYTKRALLRALSENSRSSVTELAERLKCSRSTIVSNMRSLEKEFGIKYIVEFDRNLMDYTQKHILRITLTKKPSIEELGNMFKDDDLVRLVALTEGDFDLFLDVVADSREKYAAWGIATVLKLLKYQPTMEPSMILLEHTGFIPIPNNVLENMDLSMLKIDPLDKKILLLLNSNSRMGYREMAKQLKEHVETVRYRVKRLLNMRVVKRFTIALENPPTSQNVLFFVNYRLSRGIQERTEKATQFYQRIDGSMPLINSFPFLALTSGSDLFFGRGCFDNAENAIKNTLMAQKELYAPDQPRVSYALIKKVVKGTLPIRNLDIGKEYHPLRWSAKG